MPPVIIAVVAAAASYGASALAVEAGLVLAGSFGALAIGAVAGAVVAYAGNAIYASTTRKGSVKARPSSTSASDRKQTVRSGIAPRRVVYGRARVSGPIAFMATSGSFNENIHFVVPLTGHQCAEWEEVYINEHVVTTAQVDGGGNVTGGTLAANSAIVRVYLGDQVAADALLVSTFPSDWTSAHILQGCSYVFVRVQYDETLFPQGFQNIGVLLKGAFVEDPRDTVPAAYSDNAALCIRDYLTNDVYGLGADASEIDDDSFEAAANICDEAVAIDTIPTYVERYNCNGSFQVDAKPIDVIEEMLTSCAGVITYVEGKYRLHVGAYDSPTVTLTESDFAGDLEVNPKVPRRELFNTVRGTYVAPSKQWSSSEYPAATDAAFITADGGQEIAEDFELPFTIDPTEAQRLARLKLLRSREGLSFRAPLKYSSFKLCVWDTVSVTLPALGWSAKTFRIVAWTFDPQTGMINCTFREDASSLYSWTYTDATAPPLSPDTTLVTP